MGAARQLAAVKATAKTTKLAVVQSPPPADVAAEDAAIDSYLDKAPPTFVICRVGNHYIPPADPRTMLFRRRADGYDVWTADCENCGAVFREEVWMIHERDGVVTKMEFVSSRTGYYALGKDAVPYLLPPGSGRISKRQFRQARVGRAFIGRPIRRGGR